MSSIGQPCERKLWYEFNSTDSEPLRPEQFLKFLYGDILEDVLIFLAEQAGHRVEGTQSTLDIRGIKGHRDCVIDGVTVDCKSASSYSFKKFREHLQPEGDAFGYLGQLRSYVYAGRDDPIVTDKSRGAFLVVDKTLGHICLDVHEFNFDGIEDEYERKKLLVTLPDTPPRAFEAEEFGKSGNMSLGVNCSYCPFNKTCWPSQRTFLYSNRPVTLVKVVKEPLVPELKGPIELELPDGS